MILPVKSPVSRTSSRLALRLLATTALFVAATLPADAQVIIGGEQQQADVQVFAPKPLLPSQDQWPYTVKLPRKAPKLAAVDASTLPSRQVDPKLMEAARLMQSGLTPAQVREAMTQPAPIMTAPELEGDKPDEPRDSASTLPPVATGPLMASLADNGTETPTAAATAPDTGTTDIAADNHRLVAPMPATVSDAQTAAAVPASAEQPSSMAMLGESAATPTPAATTTPAVEAPKPTSTGRALFGGKRVQVADASTTATTTSSSQSLAAPVPDAAPALDVDSTPTPPVAIPSDTARNSTPSQITPLTSLSSPPKLLARIGDKSRGAVQRPSANPVAAEPMPDAAPVEPVAPEPALPPKDDKLPAPQPAAVLPAKGEESQAALIPMPQDNGNGDDVPPAAIMATDVQSAAPPAPVAIQTATPEKKEHRTFWNRLFGSEEDHPEGAAVPLPPEMPKATVAAIAEPAVEPAPEPVVAATPVIEPAPAAITPAPMAEPAAPPAEPAAVEQPVAVEPAPVAATSAVKQRRTLWTDLFGNDAPAKPVAPVETPAVALQPQEAAPLVDVTPDEPVDTISTAGLAAPDVTTKPKTFAAAKTRTPAPAVVQPVSSPEPMPEPVTEAAPIVQPEPASQPVQAVQAVPEPEPVVVQQPVAVRTEPKPAPKVEPASVAVATAPVYNTPVAAPAVASPQSMFPQQRIPVQEVAPVVQPQVVQPQQHVLQPPLQQQVIVQQPTYLEPAATPVMQQQPTYLEPMPAAREIAAPVMPGTAIPGDVPAVTVNAQPMAPVAPPAIIPAFRIEAPSTPGNSGLVTPRLVPVTPENDMRAPSLARPQVAAAPTVTVPSGAPLAQVNFLPSSQNVDSVGQAQLQAIAEAMQMAPQTRLMLNSYAKASNEPESRRISLNRALVVRTKLAELGIQPARIDVQALGEDTPAGVDGGNNRVDAIMH